MAFWNKGDTEAYEVADVPHFIRRGPKLPDDFEQRLMETLEQDNMQQFAIVPRTAQIIADDIEHIKSKMAEAKQLMSDAEKRIAELQAELTKKLDDDAAASKARHDAELAEIERLRGTAS